jgi:hypothetical protein
MLLYPWDLTDRQWEVPVGVSAAVEKELKSSEAVILEVKKILNTNKYIDEEYSTVVAGFIDQVIEHLEAIILLTRSNINGSAFALVRSVAEVSSAAYGSRHAQLKHRC